MHAEMPAAAPMMCESSTPRVEKCSRVSFERFQTRAA